MDFGFESSSGQERNGCLISPRSIFYLCMLNIICEITAESQPAFALDLRQGQTRRYFERSDYS
jgi:hypothetical protein